MLTLVSLRLYKECGSPPEADANGWRDYNDTSYGSIVNYYCETGYTLSGNRTIVCSETGWSYTNVTCTEKGNRHQFESNAFPSQTCNYQFDIRLHAKGTHHILKNDRLNLKAKGKGPRI